MKLLVSILCQPRYLVTATIALIAFMALYLSSMQYLIIGPGYTDAFWGAEFVPRWRELVFRQRGTFLFEPIAVVEAGSLVLFVSIPNLAIGLGLGSLVAANIAVSYYGFRALGLRGARGVQALAGTLPALASGAACCVPTLILAIGLQFTATLAAVWPWLVPLSAALLVASLWWSLRGMARTCSLDRNSPG